MDRFDRLYAMLDGIKDRHFTLDGKPDQYVIRDFIGMGYHVEDEKGHVIAIVDELDSNEGFLVFSTVWMGRHIKNRVMVSNIQFAIPAGKEIAA